MFPSTITLMPDRKYLPAKKGTQEWKRKAQRKVLELFEAEPTRSIRSVAAEVGMSAMAIHSWVNRDEEFKRRLNMTRAKGDGKASPDPGSFEDWRRQYVNLQVQNPVTLKWGNVGETYAFQKPFVEALGDPSVQRMLALYPVRHGKTTIIEHLVVWYLCKNPNARIIIICRSQNHAQERAYAIQQLLLDDELYPDLHEKWGPWIGKPEGRAKPWGKRAFYVRGRRDAERSPSVSCYGVKTDTYGARADLIILDDVDSPSVGPTDRESIIRAVFGPILTRLSDGGKMVVIGTRCGPDDLYSHMLSRAGWWADVKSAIQDDGTALCPELYGLEELEAARAEGEILFQMLYQNNPAPEGSIMFAPALIDSSKGNFGIGEAPEDWNRILSMDPSASGKAALIALAQDPLKGEVRVIDLDVRLAPRHDGLREMLARGLIMHRPSQVVIEAMGGFKLFSDAPDIKAMIYDSGARLTEFQTGKNKHDPVEGVPLIATMMSQERLRFPNRDEESQRKMRPLYDSMVTWRPQTTTAQTFDEVMALWFGCNVLLAGRSPGRRTMIDPAVRNRPYLLNRRMFPGQKVGGGVR